MSASGAEVARPTLRPLRVARGLSRSSPQGGGTPLRLRCGSRRRGSLLSMKSTPRLLACTGLSNGSPPSLIVCISARSWLGRRGGDQTGDVVGVSTFIELIEILAIARETGVDRKNGHHPWTATAEICPRKPRPPCPIHHFASCLSERGKGLSRPNRPPAGCLGTPLVKFQTLRQYELRP